MLYTFCLFLPVSKTLGARIPQTTHPHFSPFPFQASLGKDLGPRPARGQEEPSPECQTPSHLCLPHSSHLEKRTRRTGNPRGSAAPSHQIRLRLLPSDVNSWDGLLGLRASQPLLPLEEWGSQRTTQVCAWTIFKEQRVWLLRVVGGGLCFLLVLYLPPSLACSVP